MNSGSPENHESVPRAVLRLLATPPSAGFRKSSHVWYTTVRITATQPKGQPDLPGFSRHPLLATVFRRWYGGSKPCWRQPVFSRASRPSGFIREFPSGFMKHRTKSPRVRRPCCFASFAALREVFSVLTPAAQRLFSGHSLLRAQRGERTVFSISPRAPRSLR
jgi:hypothetical protein